MSTCRVKCVSTFASVSGGGYMCPHCHWKYGPVIYATKGPAHDGFALKTKKDLLLGRQRPCPAGRHKIPVRQIAGTPSWIWCAFCETGWELRCKGEDGIARGGWPTIWLTGMQPSEQCDSLSPLKHYVMTTWPVYYCCSACCSFIPSPHILICYRYKIYCKIWNICMISDTRH